MVDIKWKVNKCCHQNHFCIPVNINGFPDALNFYISPDTKGLSRFVPLLVSCRPEHLVNSCVLCSLVAQMAQLVSNSSLSLVSINHKDISVISKHGYLTVNHRTGIMIDLGSRCSSRPRGSHCCLRGSHLNNFIRCLCHFWHIFSKSQADSHAVVWSP